MKKEIYRLTKAQQRFMNDNPHSLIKEDDGYLCLWCKTNKYIESVTGCKNMVECKRCDRINLAYFNMTR